MPERRADAGPKRKRDAAATREAILEAATRRFATQGYERAGAREIAADAGVTAALVNRYFGSKEALLRSRMIRPAGVAADTLTRHPPPARGGRRRLERTRRPRPVRS